MSNNKEQKELILIDANLLDSLSPEALYVYVHTAYITKNKHNKEIKPLGANYMSQAFYQKGFAELLEKGYLEKLLNEKEN